MKRLWFADVHANLPALEAVLAAAGSFDEAVFLGDIVGCGPHPSECVDRLRSLGPMVVIRGNHDDTVLAVSNPSSPRRAPFSWDAWTFDRLDAAQRAWLGNQPAHCCIPLAAGNAWLVHRPPGAGYLHPAMPDAVLAGHLTQVRHSTVACGHMHRALDRIVNGVRYIVIPSVGQPRDGDSRAAFVVETDGRFVLQRVAYDVARTARDTRRIGLDARFLQRWLRFLHTASDPEWSREYRAS